MIPLRLKADCPEAQAPFVVRLRSSDPGDDDALLVSAGDQLAYASRHGLLQLFDVAAEEVEGDVLLVVPHRNTAHRLIRAGSQHNTLLVTEQCDQLCVMCSQPPKPYHVDAFAHLKQAALLAPEGMTIGLSGGEPTLYKAELLTFLEEVLAIRPDLSFHVLTNGQHFRSEDEHRLRDLPRGRVLWGVPLYSDDPAQHDVIVGKTGAHATLLRSLAILCRAGCEVELRTVVLRSNAAGLPMLARFITTQVPFIALWALMQLENIGFGRKNWDAVFFDHSMDFAPVAAALDLAAIRGIEAVLYNTPLCTLPQAYRSRAPATISDWKRRFLPGCDGCHVQDQCSGFFAWYPEQRGFMRLGPI